MICVSTPRDMVDIVMGERTPLFCPVPVAVSAKHKSLHNTVIGSRLGNASVGGGRNADTDTVGRCC